MRIHWFSITIFDDCKNRENIWRDYLSALGVMVAKGHGGRGYREIDEGLLGAKVYYEPAHIGEKGQEHFHIEIPGQACDALVPSTFSALMAELIGNGVRFNIKRLDLAFDDVPFSPQEFREAIQSDELISLAKREKIRIEQSPYEMSEDGQREGTITVYLGSNTSQRMVRVYDKRGPVRLEFQMRDERAKAVALDIFSKKYEDWEIAAKGHLRQYMDFKNIDWWLLFVGMVVRENLVISSARQATFIKLEGWLEKQVSVALSVWFDVQGDSAEKSFKEMLVRAKKRDRSKYAAVLELAD
jgi:DNA relaxase NicK